MSNNNGGSMMIVLVIGGICCCCILLSAVLAGLYFFVDSVKVWVDDLFGIENNGTLIKQFEDKKCRGNTMIQQGTQYICSPAFPHKTNARNNPKNKPDIQVTDPETGAKRYMYDNMCVTTPECAEIVNKITL